MYRKRWLVWLMKKTKWRKPKYSGGSEIPFIPTEKQLDRKHNGLFQNSRDYFAAVFCGDVTNSAQFLSLFSFFANSFLIN